MLWHGMCDVLEGYREGCYGMECVMYWRDTGKDVMAWNA